MGRRVYSSPAGNMHLLEVMQRRKSKRWEIICNINFFPAKTSFYQPPSLFSIMFADLGGSNEFTTFLQSLPPAWASPAPGEEPSTAGWTAGGGMS